MIKYLSCFLFLPLLSNAQLADTLVVDTDELRLKLIAKNIQQPETMDSLQALLQAFGQLIPDIASKIPTDQYYLVYFNTVDISIHTIGPEKKYYIQDGKLRENPRPNRAKLQGMGLTLEAQFADLQQLTLAQLQPNLDQLKKGIAAQKTNVARFSRTMVFEVENNGLTYNEGKSKNNGTLDMLAIRGGLGTGVLKNRFVTDFSFELGIWTSRKGVLRHQYYAATNILYDFGPENNFKTSQFVSLGYRHNFAKNNGPERWLGAEFGYLIRNGSHLLEDNTFRFSLNFDLKKNLSLSPQIYMSDGFKKIYPGIRLGIGF